MLPIACTENNRDDSGFAGMKAFHRALHFDTVAVVRFEEVGADEQKNDLVTVDMATDRLVDVLPGPQFGGRAMC